jgi:hypothetical protein
MKIVAMLAGPVLTLISCQDIPPAYPVPEQRPSFEGYKEHSPRLVNMGDADAPRHFVRDISPELNGSWRWSRARPAVSVRVRSDEALKYKIDFTLPEITFKETGPVTIAFLVNDHMLDRLHYTRSGDQHFEKTVPAGWIEVGKEAIVGAEIDKLWTSQKDGARFGFIITRIGLTE